MGRMTRRAFTGATRPGQSIAEFWLQFPIVAQHRPNRSKNASRKFAVEALESRTLLATIPATLVRDINTVDTYPAELTPAGTNLFYTVKGSGPTGVELAITTVGGGSRLLQDFTPGPPVADPSYPNDPPTGPEDLTAVGNSVYFLASSGTSQDTLWTSNGSSVTQVSFADPADSAATVVSNLVAVGNTLYFTAQDPGNAQGVYTSRVDLWQLGPGDVQPVLLEPALSSEPNGVSDLTAVGNLLYFSVTNGATYDELWQTDGTAAGTEAVSYTSTSSGQTQDITNVNSIVNFNGVPVFAVDAGGPTLEELGLEGPVSLATFSPGDGPANFAVAGSQLFFVASDGTHGRELWVTNGTAQGTAMVKDIVPGSTGSYPTNLTSASGTLYFTITGPTDQNELWQSNGTSRGTALVTDLPGQPSNEHGYYGYGYGAAATAAAAPLLGAVGETLYFADSDSAHGEELWSTSPTQPPALVADIDPGPSSSAPHDFAEFNGALYFAAHNGSVPEENQLWEISGTTPQLVQSFSPSATNGSYVSAETAQLGQSVLFVADDGVNGPELWITSGTAAGTSLVADVDPSALVTLGSSAYFLTLTSSGSALWVTNGTAGGTSVVANLPQAPPSYGGSSQSLVAADGELYFVTTDGTAHGEDLWESNGSPAGTGVVKDFTIPAAATGVANPGLANLTAAGSLLYFTANDGVHGDQLWVTTGTASGTQMMSDINSQGAGGDPSDLTAVGNDVYFVAYEADNNVALWVSNGTAAGTLGIKDDFPTITMPVASPAPGQPATQSVAPSITALAAAGSSLYLVVEYIPDQYTGSSAVLDTLWTSNGTDSGTSQVAAPAPELRLRASARSFPWAARSSSSPTTARTATSCGAQTARPQAR